MSSAKEYYENAEECFDWARTAKTERNAPSFSRWLRRGLMLPAGERSMRRVMNEVLDRQNDESD